MFISTFQEIWNNRERSREMCESAKETLKDLLFQLSTPLSQEATALVGQAKSQMQQRFLHGFHQLVAVGLCEKGQDYVGIQQDVPIGQASTCAEVVAMAGAIEANASLKLMVAVHHKRPDQDGEPIHVVPPCGLCRERILHFFPDCQVIIWLKGELRMLPIQLLLPLPYKTKRPGENGGQAVSVFTA